MEACLGATAVWREMQPHRRSARWINSGRRLLATQRSQLTTGARGTVVYLQHIVAIVGVESIKLHFHTGATGYWDSPRTSLVVRIIPWVARAWKWPRWRRSRGWATWKINTYSCAHLKTTTYKTGHQSQTGRPLPSPSLWEQLLSASNKVKALLAQTSSSALFELKVARISLGIHFLCEDLPSERLMLKEFRGLVFNNRWNARKECLLVSKGC